MTLEELAKELSATYDQNYVTDRERGLEEFGRKHREELTDLEQNGTSIEKLVEAAQIGPAGYWAKQIRKGM